MNTQNHIEVLIKKFKQGNLSPDEAKELYSIAKEEDDNEVFKEILENYWQKSTKTVMNVPSDKMLKNLQHNLHKNLKEKSVSSKTGIQKLVPFLRYAAVIVFAAGLTWLVQDKFNEITNSSKMSAEDTDTEISVSFGSKTKVSLPDGSVVHLNSGSTLRYPKHFDTQTRNVYLEGEAFFDVKKDAKHPFYVKTHDITIKVLGTTFNVKSYPDEKTIQTTLVTGSIEIYSNQKGISEKSRLMVLKPNQQVVFEKIEGKIEITNHDTTTVDGNPLPVKPIIVNSEPDMTQAIAWKDNRFVFRDEKFVDLARRLERWYNVEIEITNKELLQAKFSGVFVKETIEQALDALKIAMPFQYQMEKNRIIISK